MYLPFLVSHSVTSKTFWEDLGELLHTNVRWNSAKRWFLRALHCITPSFPMMVLLAYMHISGDDAKRGDAKSWFNSAWNFPQCIAMSFFVNHSRFLCLTSDEHWVTIFKLNLCLFMTTTMMVVVLWKHMKLLLVGRHHCFIIHPPHPQMGTPRDLVLFNAKHWCTATLILCSMVAAELTPSMTFFF